MAKDQSYQEFLAFFNLDKTAKAVDGVKPATGRGFVHGVLWCVGFAAIVGLGSLLAPSFAAGWAIVALVVMAVVWKVWAARFGIHRVSTDVPHELG